MYEVSASSFYNWVSHPGYHVLMIHRANCPPCRAAMPVYRKLAARTKHLQIQFGSYEFQLTKEDRDFLEYLNVTATPTFQVYSVRRELIHPHVHHMDRIFSVTSVKKIPELEDFLKSLNLD